MKTQQTRFLQSFFPENQGQCHYGTSYEPIKQFHLYLKILHALAILEYLSVLIL